MKHPVIVHDTFVIERAYRASPTRVFRAWADPEQKRRWFVEGENWTIESYENDFREGGFERSRFRFADGPEMTCDTLYHDIVPDRRIVSSYAMTIGGQRLSVSLSTLEIEASGAGTRMRYTEQAAFFDGGAGVRGRREGCAEMLEKLATELGETD